MVANNILRLVARSLVVLAVLTFGAPHASADWLDSVKSAIKIPQASDDGSDAGTPAAPSAGQVILAQLQQNQTQLIRSFVESQEFLLQAQMLLASAFGLKEQLTNLEVEAEALASGNTVDDTEKLERLRKITREAQEAIREKLEEGGELSKESKIQLAKSLVPFARSVVIAVRMVPEGAQLANEIQSQIMSANPFAIFKLKDALTTGIFITPKLPGYLQNQTLQLRDLVIYAKKNDVEVPDEASDLI